MYADTQKSVENLIGLVRATVWNYDAERKLRKLIKDTSPDAVYILHEVNHLSPSIIRAAKKEGILLEKFVGAHGQKGAVVLRQTQQLLIEKS